MAELAIAASLVQAYGTIQQGKATDAMYKAQADQTLVQAKSQVLQSRQQELKHREDGIKVLEQMKRNAATINARASAGSLDPFSGSIGNLMTVNLDQGFRTLRRHETIDSSRSKIRSSYRRARSIKRRSTGRPVKPQSVPQCSRPSQASACPSELTA